MGCGCTPNDDIVHCGTSISDLKKLYTKYILAQAKCTSFDCIMQNEYVTYNHGGGQKGTQQSMTEQACWKENYGGLKDFIDKNKFYFLSTLINAVSKKNKFDEIVKNKKVEIKKRKAVLSELKASKDEKAHAVKFMLSEIKKFHSINC
jgi:hypothetical protein